MNLIFIVNIYRFGMYEHAHVLYSHDQVTPHLSALQPAHSFQAVGLSSKKLFLDRITIANNPYRKNFLRYSLRCYVVSVAPFGWVAASE